MRIVRSTAVASVTFLAAAFAAPNMAQSSGLAEPADVARAKLQLLALAGLASAQQGEALAPDFAGAAGDHVASRLESAFDLVAPDLDAARVPRSRPEESADLVALAYAEEPAKPARRNAARGVTAIENLVAKHAADQNVPADLAQALVQVESGFNPKARGRNGEIGLLQIKAQTARAMGYKGPAKELYDAETNLAFGMKYLAEAHDRSGGDTCGTLLRYNSGLDAKRASKGSRKFCAKVKSVMAKRA